MDEEPALTGIKPFRLIRRITASGGQIPEKSSRRSIATFPTSLGTSTETWKALYDEFYDAVAVGDRHTMTIFYVSGSHKTVRVNLPRAPVCASPWF